jgi:hypothetical protein
MSEGAPAPAPCLRQSVLIVGSLVWLATLSFGCRSLLGVRQRKKESVNSSAVVELLRFLDETLISRYGSTAVGVSMRCSAQRPGHTKTSISSRA